MAETYGYDKTPTPPRDYDVNKVPAEIRKRTEWVKSKFTGEDVAEAYRQVGDIAGIYAGEAKQLAERTQIRQDAVEDQFDAVQRLATETADWGGEIVVASDGEATLKNRLDRDYAQVLKTLNYLADLGIRVTSNGVDDTGAISIALDQLIAAGKGTLFLPDENYHISGIQKLGSVHSSLGSITITGGDDTEIKLLNGSNKTVIHLEFLDYLEINKIKINGNRVNQAMSEIDGLFVRYCKELKIEGSKSYYNQNSGFVLRGIQRILFNGNEGWQNSSSTSIAGDGAVIYAIEGTVNNNRFYDNNKTPVGYIGSYDGDGIQIMHGMSDVLGWYEESKGLGFIKSNGNYCYGNGRRGIKIQRPKVISIGDECARNGTKQMSVVHSAKLYDVFIFAPILGDSQTVSESSFSIEGVSTKHTNIKLIDADFKGTVTNNGVDIYWCDDFELRGLKNGWTAVAGFDYTLRDSTSNGFVDVKSNRINNLGENNDISDGYLIKQKIRRKYLPKGIATTLVTVPIPMQESVAIQLDYMISQVGTNNLPINSATGFNASGNIIVSIFRDAAGNITVAPIDKRETKSSDGITVTTNFTVSLAGNNLNLVGTISHEDAENRHATMIADAKIYKMST